MAVMSKAEWNRRRRRKKKIRKYSILAGMAIILVLLLLLIIKLISWIFSGTDDGLVEKVVDYKVTQKLLTVNEWTRPGTKLDKVTQIIVHSTGEPNVNAVNRRDQYEAMKDTHTSTDTPESMHFIIGTDGTIVQCIPINEAAFASKRFNECGISVEFCNTDAEGAMSKATYESLVSLVAYLCDEFNLTPGKDAILRHSDVTGRMCPLFFATNADSWTQFLDDVAKELKGKDYTLSNPIIRNSAVNGGN